ncbi:MAG: molybdopterin-dependent oxidoreductase [Chloroflexota bacterium]|nr:molybdopterin-dependent oxidoreductase [Chloroflexota bacterium]
MDIRKTLPVHDVPREARQNAVAPRLRVEGLVANPMSLAPGELASLPHASLSEAFSCEEGWTVPEQRWSGIALGEVLRLAGPLPEARFVRVGAGEYVVPLAILDARSAVLCDTLNDAPIPLAHGAPWRLFVPGTSCSTSVKWVDRLELASEAGENSGERIARGRLASKP